MTVHAIDKLDFRAGDEPRRIYWNDETGEVSGDHSDVPDIRETMARAVRDGYLPQIHGHWALRDPRRDPAEFLVVLFWPGPAPFDDEDRASRRIQLPPALRIDPAPFTPNDLPDGEVA